MELEGKELEEFNNIARHFLSDEQFLRMGDFIQHGRISTLDHCIDVAEQCFFINRKYSLGLDEKVLVEAALLHDFYLYDWHVDEEWHRLHGIQHPEFAKNNAVKFYGVDEHTASAIRTHMWPLTLKNIPKSGEAWLICMVDKGVSLKETLFKRK